MSQNQEQKDSPIEEETQDTNASENETVNAEFEQTTEEESDLTEALKAEIAELKDKYIRLYSEFDNHKKRTSKEKLDLIRTANEDLMSALIPVVDDFDRAQKSISSATEIATVVEGIELIQTKLVKTLENKGLKAMSTDLGTTFDTELHEAITQFAAPSEELKGKIIDTAEKGYFIYDKVVRFAKVIVGS